MQEVYYVHQKQNKKFTLVMRRQEDTEERLERVRKISNLIFGILIVNLTVLFTAIIQIIVNLILG